MNLSAGDKQGGNTGKVNENSNSKGSASKVAVPKSCITITTEAVGYNSGRKYYLQACSEAERHEIVQGLMRKFKTARKSKETKGHIRRIQKHTLRITGSIPFQYFFASLIAAVSSPSFLP